MTKMLSASGGLCPPDQGLCPWTPQGALPPDRRYRLVLRTRHGASQPVTPSAAYASEAEPPLLHITTLTTAYAATAHAPKYVTRE